MTRPTLALATACSAVLLTLVACGRNDDSTPAITAAPPVVSKPTTTEQVLQLIRSCEVEELFFPSGDLTYIAFRSGTTVRVARLDRDALARAANAAREGGCDIRIAIE